MTENTSPFIFCLLYYSIDISSCSFAKLCIGFVNLVASEIPSLPLLCIVPDVVLVVVLDVTPPPCRGLCPAGFREQKLLAYTRVWRSLARHSVQIGPSYSGKADYKIIGSLHGASYPGVRI